MGLSSAVVVGCFERHPGGVDRLDGLVVDRLAARPAVLQPEIDRDEIEPDRQRLGQAVDRPRQLRADAVAQELGDRIGRTHQRPDLQVVCRRAGQSPARLEPPVSPRSYRDSEFRLYEPPAKPSNPIAADRELGRDPLGSARASGRYINIDRDRPALAAWPLGFSVVSPRL